MGKTLRELRKESNLPNNTILCQMNIETSTLYAWESGYRLIPIDRLYRLLDLYNYPISEFDFAQLIENHEQKKVKISG